jgi:glycerol-3-phosphate O-acyltransferase
VLTAVAVGLGALVAYEILRAIIVSRLRRRFRAAAIRFVRKNRIHLEQARFMDRAWIRERLAMDPEVDRQILDIAERTGESIPILRDRVDAYVEEIAPFFSIAMYYRLGATLAKRIVDFCFELVMDPAAFEAQSARVPDGAVRVYVINHRSNTHSVVLSYGLLRRIALSYAVGEWALVWPLHSLFRAFGSYFVRRGEKDPLYHKVLERFLQLLAGHGGVTGFFIEGGLSRDGALRPAKSGLLDYLVGLRREFPDRDIAFLPVGLNYDRVLEDRTLVAERDGPVPKPRLHRRLLNLGGLVFWVPTLIAANAAKVAMRSHRKFGYAAIAFGEPLVLSRWPGGPELHTLPDEVRRAKIQELADELLFRRVGAVVPATPVPVLCEALGRGAVHIADVHRRVREVLSELRASGAPIAFGEAFASVEARRQGGAVESIPGGVDDELLDLEEAELLTLLAGHALARRRVIRHEERALRVVPGEEPIVAYYALSIRHHLPATARGATS